MDKFAKEKGIDSNPINKLQVMHHHRISIFCVNRWLETLWSWNRHALQSTEISKPVTNHNHVIIFYFCDLWTGNGEDKLTTTNKLQHVLVQHSNIFF